MPFAALLLICAALGWWIGSRKRRNAERQRNQREVEATLQRGMPAPETAIGQKAQEVAEAQAKKLSTPPPIHGSARWATETDASSLIEPTHWERSRRGNRNLFLGNLLADAGLPSPDEPGRDTGLPLVVQYPGHILTVAGTGQGKSATQIIGNLLTYNGSVVVLDPKGELYAATAARRRQFGKVFRLAPLAKANDPKSDRYNPLDELDDPRELGSRARRLAEMLIVRQGNKGAAEATFFENEAINLLTAVIMHVVQLTAKPQLRHLRTLAEVRRICTLPILGSRPERSMHVKEYIEDIFIQMAQLPGRDYVRRQGSVFQGYESKLLGSFMSEINANMAFWDDHPGFAEVTGASDFRFADLEREPTTVYLSIPLKDMSTSYRYLRAMVGAAFSALEEKQEAKRASVLFVLDEFPALRDMDFMRDAIAQMRSSGAWFWIFIQDIAQLEEQYGRSADVFLSQTDHQIYFGGLNDAKTRKHLSTALGVSTYPYRDANLSWGHNVGVSDGVSEQLTQLGGVNRGRSVGQSVNIADPVALAPRPLLTPFEVGTFLSLRQPGETHPSTAIILSKQAGGYPIKARRQHWKVQEQQPAAPNVVPLRTGT